ncbi:hypothetical protein PPL_11980 [Heterostelium album PN500]|uniref:Ankyrin repeat protein n=1 Tax=Heterostelium pallidum (strain ATCC 26659 / Pp 5 / PN500) TaxID=670386 RepID=D3BV08_HETP5|nr:hypothetical protein PPL_11980 [Heterostelium album PN500]EFA74946.1 hypothetical protein PPL_11980 [Heterostelium album PN500]|eukprot:XP_020427080.1 hypothetical protein PPL_11980 [Heterostelium album PN500]
MKKELFVLIFNNIVLSQKIFNDVVSIVNMNGSLKHFKWNKVLKRPGVMAANGYFDQLKTFLETDGMHQYTFKRRVSISVLVDAVRSGSLEIIDYLLDQYRMTERIELASWREGFSLYCLDTMMSVAASHQRIDVVQFLIDRFPNYRYCYRKIFASLVSSNRPDLEMVEFIANKKDDCEVYKRECCQDMLVHNNVLNRAAHRGNLEVIRWLLANRSEDLDQSTMLSYAVMGKQIDVIRYLVAEHGEPKDKNNEEYINDALYSEDAFDMFKLLYDLGCACSEDIMDRAAASGSMKVLKWLHENTTFKCTTNAIDNAAYKNRLDIVKWLHENRSEGCTVEAMNKAVDKGNLELVQWLHDNRTEGCSDEAWRSAIQNGDLSMVKWLHENRTERYSAANIMDEIALAGQSEILEWFEQNTSERCSNTVLEQVGDIGVIKYLHERNEGEANRFGFSTDTMDNTWSLVTIKWLHENRSEGCTEKAYMHAIDRDNVKIDDIMHIDVPLTETKDISKTKFQNKKLYFQNFTATTLYEFLVLPFGMSEAPAVFNRFVKEI